MKAVVLVIAAVLVVVCVEARLHPHPHPHPHHQGNPRSKFAAKAHLKQHQTTHHHRELDEVERLLGQARSFEEFDLNALTGFFSPDSQPFSFPSIEDFRKKLSLCTIALEECVTCDDAPDDPGKVKGWGKRFVTCVGFETGSPTKSTFQTVLTTVRDTINGVADTAIDGLASVTNLIDVVAKVADVSLWTTFSNLCTTTVNGAVTAVGGAPAILVSKAVGKIVKGVGEVLSGAENPKTVACNMCATSMLWAIGMLPDVKAKTLFTITDEKETILQKHDEELTKAVTRDSYVSSKGIPYGHLCGNTAVGLPNLNTNVAPDSEFLAKVIQREDNAGAILRAVQEYYYENEIKNRLDRRIAEILNSPVEAVVEGGATVTQKAAEIAGIQAVADAAKQMRPRPIDFMDVRDIASFYFTTGTEADYQFFSWRTCSDAVPLVKPIRRIGTAVGEVGSLVFDGVGRVGGACVDCAKDMLGHLRNFIR